MSLITLDAVLFVSASCGKGLIQGIVKGLAVAVGIGTMGARWQTGSAPVCQRCAEPRAVRQGTGRKMRHGCWFCPVVG